MKTYIICSHELGLNGQYETESQADGSRRSARYWQRLPGNQQLTRCYRPSLSRVRKPKDGWSLTSLSGLDQQYLPLVSDLRVEWWPSDTYTAVIESEMAALYRLIKDDLETGFTFDIEGLFAQDIQQNLTYGRLMSVLRLTKMTLRRYLIQVGRIGRWD